MSKIKIFGYRSDYSDLLFLLLKAHFKTLDEKDNTNLLGRIAIEIESDNSIPKEDIEGNKANKENRFIKMIEMNKLDFDIIHNYLRCLSGIANMRFRIITTSFDDPIEIVPAWYHQFVQQKGVEPWYISQEKK